MNNTHQSPLVQGNNLTLSSYGLWSRSPDKGISYSDGDAAENTLQELLRNADDRSSRSLELEAAIYDWVSEYHLSSDRANIYRFLNLDGLRSGLELGAGCGAITRYLGELGISLDAVEGNRRRAEICRLRCNELENVAVIQANFNDLELSPGTYDAVFLNGVLEYAGMFLPKSSDDRAALQEILSRSLAALTDQGLLCIAIENRIGLKYWLGAREDHFGKPYVGLYGYPEQLGIRTYDRHEWDAIFSGLDSGCASRFIYPFPDYKMARAILAEEFIENYPHAYSNLYRMLSRDNADTIQADMNEFLLWEGLHATGLLPQFANSFFIVLAKDEDRLATACPYDFMHFSGSGRKPAYRICTSKRRGEEVVRKEAMLPQFAAEGSEKLVHNLLDAPYLNGPLLVNRWVRALTAHNPGEFDECIREYYRYLQRYWQENAQTGDAFDLLPFNIVTDDEGEYQRFDTEWHVQASFSPEFVLFRALLWFPATNETLLGPLLERYKLETVHDFIRYGFGLVSLSLEEYLEQFISLEESIQSEIEVQVRSHPVERLLKENLRRRSRSAEADTLLVQLYWAGEEETWSDDRSVEERGRLGVDSQAILFKLPPAEVEVTGLRLDPADQAGFIHIHSLNVFARSTENGSDNLECVWSLVGSGGIAAAAVMENLHYCRNGLGEVFVATGDDPFLIFDLPEKVREKIGGRSLSVEVEMDWPRSADFLIAMDSLGRKVVQQELDRKRTIEETTRKYAEELKERSDQVRAKDIHIRNLETELEAMKQTRVWRSAELLREKVYYRLLGAKGLLGKSVHTLRKEGVRQFLRKTKRILGGTPSLETVGLNKRDYDLWIEKNRLTDADLARISKEVRGFASQPLISIVVPVYNVDEVWLAKMIESVRSQLYEKWELCLCDDCSPKPHIRQVLERYRELDDRIKVDFSQENGGIAVASNRALALATGDFVGLLDHDDELTVDALYQVVKVINEEPEADLIYSDEDKLDMAGERVDPFFKPDFSPELIYSQNYICHFTTIRKAILDTIGGFREGYDGSQDHDLILRSIEGARKVYHIPKVLYHWRKIPGSTAAVYDSKSYAWEAGRKAIEESMARRGIRGTVGFAKYQGSYRVQREIIGNPLVSIIIPFKDQPEYLDKCIDSILGKSTYANYEILGVNNGSSDPATRETMGKLAERDRRVRFADHDIPFNFAALCNFGVKQARGEYVVLLNNDIEIISPDWLENMLGLAQSDEIGAVGGKLIYPDQRIQHAGIVIGMAGVAGHPHHFFHKDDVGYYARPHVIHNVSAVTGACMMVSRELYLQSGGMDEVHFGVAYNDVDFCLKLRKQGLRNVFTPYSEMVHYESVSRGYEDTPEKLQRLQREADFLAQKWPEYIGREDPYYSPHLSLASENFSIRI